MKTIHCLRTFSALILLLPAVAAADVYQCDGKWTNKPCSGAVTQKLGEAPAHAVSAGDPIPSQNRSLFHELTMKSIKAREQFDVRVDLANAEKICLKQSSTLADCTDEVQAAEALLDQKTTAASALETQKKANDLQEESNRLQDERNRIESEKPNVVVDQRPIIVVPRDRFVHGRPPFGNESGASIQVTGSAANGQGSITVNGTTTQNTGSTIIGGGSSTDHSVIVSDHSGTHVTPGPFAKPRKNASSATE